MKIIGRSIATPIEMVIVIIRTARKTEMVSQRKAEGLALFQIGRNMIRKHSAEFNRIRAELHYWQMRVRLDIRSLLGSIRKCKEIAKKLRSIDK